MSDFLCRFMNNCRFLSNIHSSAAGMPKITSYGFSQILS